VKVPFRKKEMLGFVVEESSQKPGERLREVTDIFDEASPFTESLFKLAEWMSEYYSCSLGQALHSVFPFSFSYKEDTKLNFTSLKKEATKREIYLVNPEDRKFEFVLSQTRKMQEHEKQVLILVPEISLISSFEEKMQKWKIKTATFHSKISPRERYRRWLAMKEGKVQVAIGTRSVVFSPFPNIGLIIVDEEESTDYKQKETPKYDVRRVAMKRGELEGFPVVLMSYSPSLESWYSAKRGMYELIHLSNGKKAVFSQVGPAPQLPSYYIVDLKKEKKKNRVFSFLLQRKIIETLGEGFPVLLFVPHRGYANFLLCHECGQVIRCPNCSIGLNFHLRKEMICHWCGFKKDAPQVCPSCKGRDLKKVGWGTQRVELEVKRRFPQAKVERFDLDVFKSSPNIIPERIKEKKVDILVGTQLLIKEEIISLVDVVGIILIDTLFNLPDFRATEHTFHFLNKIRRSMKKGASLVIQTYNPTYYALTMEGDKFYSEELKIRRALGYPPFQRWIRILLEGRIKSKVKDKSNEIAKELEVDNLNFLGPSPCPFFKAKGRYRYHIILRDDSTKCLKKSIKKISSKTMGGSVKIGIDVDPLVIM